MSYLSERHRRVWWSYACGLGFVAALEAVCLLILNLGQSLVYALSLLAPFGKWKLRLQSTLFHLRESAMLVAMLLSLLVPFLPARVVRDVDFKFDWVYRPLPTICGPAKPQRLLTMVCCDPTLHVSTQQKQQQQAKTDDSDGDYDGCLPAADDCQSCCIRSPQRPQTRVIPVGAQSPENLLAVQSARLETVDSKSPLFVTTQPSAQSLGLEPGSLKDSQQLDAQAVGSKDGRPSTPSSLAGTVSLRHSDTISPTKSIGHAKAKGVFAVETLLPRMYPSSLSKDMLKQILCFTVANDRIATCSTQGPLIIWTLDSHECVLRCPVSCLRCCFSPDGKSISVSVSQMTSYVIVLDASTGVEQFRVEVPKVRTSDLISWSFSGQYIAVTGELDSEQQQPPVNDSLVPPQPGPVQGMTIIEVHSHKAIRTLHSKEPRGDMTCFAWAVGSESMLAVGQANGIVAFFDIASSDISLRQVICSEKRIWSLAWSPFSRTQLAVGASDGTVRILDSESLQIIQEIKGFKMNIYHLAWSPFYSTELAVLDGIVHVLDTSLPPQAQRLYEIHSAHVNSARLVLWLTSKLNILVVADTQGIRLVHLGISELQQLQDTTTASNAASSPQSVTGNQSQIVESASVPGLEQPSLSPSNQSSNPRVATPTLSTTSPPKATVDSPNFKTNRRLTELIHGGHLTERSNSRSSLLLAASTDAVVHTDALVPLKRIMATPLDRVWWSHDGAYLITRSESISLSQPLQVSQGNPAAISLTQQTSSTLHVVKALTGTLMCHISPEDDSELVTVALAHSTSPRIIACSFVNGQIKLYNMMLGTLLREFQSHKVPIWCLLWAPLKQHLLVCGDAAGQVFVLDTKSMAVCSRASLDVSDVWSLAWNPSVPTQISALGNVMGTIDTTTPNSIEALMPSVSAAETHRRRTWIAYEQTMLAALDLLEVDRIYLQSVGLLSWNRPRVRSNSNARSNSPGSERASTPQHTSSSKRRERSVSSEATLVSELLPAKTARVSLATVGSNVSLNINPQLLVNAKHIPPPQPISLPPPANQSRQRPLHITRSQTGSSPALLGPDRYLTSVHGAVHPIGPEVPTVSSPLRPKTPESRLGVRTHSHRLEPNLPTSETARTSSPLFGSTLQLVESYSANQSFSPHADATLQPIQHESTATQHFNSNEDLYTASQHFNNTHTLRSVRNPVIGQPPANELSLTRRASEGTPHMPPSRVRQPIDPRLQQPPVQVQSAISPISALRAAPNRSITLAHYDAYNSIDSPTSGGFSPTGLRIQYRSSDQTYHEVQPNSAHYRPIMRSKSTTKGDNHTLSPSARMSYGGTSPLAPAGHTRAIQPQLRRAPSDPLGRAGELTSWRHSNTPGYQGIPYVSAQPHPTLNHLLTGTHSPNAVVHSIEIKRDVRPASDDDESEIESLTSDTTHRVHQLSRKQSITKIITNL